MMQPDRYRTPRPPAWRWPVVLGLLGVLAWLQWTGMRGAAYYPTRDRVARRMLGMAYLRPGELLYDLGAGDGRVVVAAARDHGARAIGVELDPIRCILARARARIHGMDGLVRVVRTDLFDIDLSDADVVTCYLTQRTNDRLAAKLSAELRPGARVVSNTYTFTGRRFEPIGRDAMVRIFAYEMVGEPE